MTSTALASLYGGKVARQRREGKALAGNVGGQEREQTVLTPRWFLDELIRRAGMPIALDPCTTPENPTQAKAHCSNTEMIGGMPSPFDNGLIMSWHDTAKHLGGFVYVNPPYADLQTWLRKCAAEAELGAQIYALVPWRSNRDWFCAHLRSGATATTIAPIAFVGSKSGFPAPLCVLSWNLPAPQSIVRVSARQTKNIVTGVFKNTYKDF